jgi:ammonium transporter, Amt family
VLGVRRGWPTSPMPPHNLAITVAGTGMLWVGWYGFNAGSALGASGSAAMALVVTQISAATAAITWMAIEWLRAGRPSVLGIVTGSIAGLAAITPASGFVGPVGALGIGLASGCACFWASVVLKARLGYDDSLDVFGVHGVGGFVGTVLAGLFASEVFGGLKGDLGIGRQLGIQLFAASLTALYAAGMTYAIAKAVDRLVGLRISEQGEEQGLDLHQHGESGYNF